MWRLARLYDWFFIDRAITAIGGSMRHLFAVILMLCSTGVAAQQADDRRVSTVQIDEQSEPPPAPAQAPPVAQQPDERLPLARQLLGVSQAASGAPATPELEILARTYAENMSIAELRDTIAFQDSPSGRAFIAASERARANLEPH
jgi:hypothetical protein